MHQCALFNFNLPIFGLGDHEGKFLAPIFLDRHVFMFNPDGFFFACAMVVQHLSPLINSSWSLKVMYFPVEIALPLLDYRS